MIYSSSIAYINKILIEELKFRSSSYLESFFKEFNFDKRTLSFIGYYNRTVLEKERISFGEFKHQWAIQGMTTNVINYFDENYDILRKEIIVEKNIVKFYRSHCCTERKEASFCSKLFHTHLPADFPPLDNPIKVRFNLKNEDFIKSVLIVRDAYTAFIKDNMMSLSMIRSVLAAPEYKFLRINEVSDIRLIDMYFWFKENRRKR